MKNHHHTHGQAPKARPVRFEFKHPSAANVCLAGSFNDWQPGRQSLRPSEEHSWLEEMELTPGVYEYCFVVDGEWVPDPLAKESVPNPFGGRNSVLIVPEAPASDDSAVPSPAASTRKPSKRQNL